MTEVSAVLKDTYPVLCMVLFIILPLYNPLVKITWVSNVASLRKRQHGYLLKWSTSAPVNGSLHPGLIWSSLDCSSDFPLLQWNNQQSTPSISISYGFRLSYESTCQKKLEPRFFKCRQDLRFQIGTWQFFETAVRQLKCISNVYVDIYEASQLPPEQSQWL